MNRASVRIALLSGLAGGLVVAVFGAIAISAGWVESDDDPAAVAQAPLTRPAASGSGEALTVGEIFERTGPGVVHVEADTGGQGADPLDPLPSPGGTATGSGFVIDTDGHIITNAHVVEGAEAIQVQLSDDAEPVDAELVGSDPSTDIAVLRADADSADLHPLPFGSSADARVGDPVVAIGNPFGLDRTVTSGIVSALHRQISSLNEFTITEAIQTDAPINPGNSGGPLLDATGQVIGVNAQIATGGGNGSVGIGFAVPIDTAREVAGQILDDGEADHAYLGITVTDVDPELDDTLNLGVDQGALVQEVAPDGPAEEAGIEGGSGRINVDGARIAAGGDVIVAIDGEPVDSGDDVVNGVAARNPGDQIEIELVRDGEHITVTATLGDRPTEVDTGSAPNQIPELP
jgi:S1-C subfamily serine protease